MGFFSIASVQQGKIQSSGSKGEQVNSPVSAGGKEGKNWDVLPDNTALVEQEPETSLCQLLNRM